MREAVEHAGERVREVWDRVPVSDDLEDALLKALGGLKDLALDPAMASVSEKQVIKRFAKHGHDLEAIHDIRRLDLQQIDQVMPKLGLRYSAATAIEGAVAGLAITGGEALAALGSIAGAGVGAAPGAGTIVGAIAVDAATVVAASARVTAHIGTFYGYEILNPQEELFALSAMNFSSSSSQAGKLMAYQQLSKLTQQLVRNKTWQELNEHAIVRVITEVFTRLGLGLTKRKAGQAVPVIGAIVGAGLNASYLRTVAQDADLAYRIRLLSERNGLDPTSLTPDIDVQPADAAGDYVDIDEIVDQERDESD
jgi:hypothetical protein